MTVDLTSPAVVAGLGLFETMLVRNGRIAHLERHASRMASSASALGLPVPDGGEFRDRAIIAAGAAAYDCAVRVVWLAAGSERWLLDARRFEIPEPTLARRARGRAMTLAPSLRRALPRHKLTSYAVCTLALRDAVRSGADEALFVDERGGVLEGTSTNVFATSEGSLVTAPVEAGVLPGVVRGWVVEQAAAEGLRVEERTPSVDEIRRGGFFTGSLTTIAAIRSVDGVPCDHPAGLERILRRYEDALA